MINYALYPLTNQRGFVADTAGAVSISSAAYKAVTAIFDAGAWIVRRYKRSRTIGELSRLSDQMLKDIGIERHDITRLADGLLDAPARRASATVTRFTPRPVTPYADNDNERRFSAMI